MPARPVMPIAVEPALLSFGMEIHGGGKLPDNVSIDGHEGWGLKRQGMNRVGMLDWGGIGPMWQYHWRGRGPVPLDWLFGDGHCQLSTLLLTLQRDCRQAAFFSVESLVFY